MYMKKHKPVSPVGESPFLSLSASVSESEEDGEAVSPFASNKKEILLHGCMFQ